jgi:PAS domain S-box-containing protein
MSKKNCSIEGKAKVVLSLLSDIAVIVDEKGRLVVVNDAFEDVTGLSQKAVTGKPFLDLEILPAESKKILLENLMKRMQGLPVEPYEVYFTDKTGKSNCVEVKGRKVSYAGQPADLVVFHDVTRRKENALRLKEYSERMEALVNEKVKEIRESEEKRRVISDITSDFVFSCVKKPQGKFAIDWMAGATEKVFGYSASEIKNKGCWKFTVQPQDLPIFEEKVAGLKLGQSSVSEFRIAHKDGSTRWVEVSARVEQDSSNPKNYRLFGACRDITRRKQMQQDLQANETKFRAITNSALDAIFMFDGEDKIAYWNPAAARIFGYADNEIVGDKVNATLVPPRFREEHLKLITKLAKSKSRTGAGGHWEFPALRKDGTEFPMELSMAPFKLNAKTYFMAIARDVTERKKAEEALRESEARYRTLFERMDEGFALFEIIYDEKGKPRDFRHLAVNPAFEHQTGLKAQDVVGKTILELFPSAEPVWFERYSKVVLTGEPANFEDYSGSQGLWFEVHAFRMEPDKLGVTFTNTTNRKKAEEALKKSVEKEHVLADLVKNASVAVGVGYPDGRLGMVNCAFQELTGYTEEELQQISWSEVLTPPEYLEMEYKKLAEIHHTKKSVQYAKEYIRKDGSRVPIELVVHPFFDSNGNVTHYFAFITDIKERKKAEEALRESEEKHRMLFEESMDAIFVVDAETGVIIDCNRAASELAGREKSELVGKHERILNPRPEIEGGFSRIFKQYPKGQRLESQVITKEGEIKDVSIKASLVEFRGKKMLHGIFRDITERKKMQQALSESEEKYRKLFEESNDAIFVADAEAGIIIDCNHRATELTGKAKSELIGQHQRTLHPQTETEGEFSRTFKMHFEEKEGQPLKSQVITKSGELRDVSIVASQLDLGDKRLVIGSFRDVTKEKRMQDALREEHYKLEAIADSIGAGFIVIGKDYRILWANKFIREYKGDVEGKLCYSTLNSLDAPCPDCGVKKVFEQGALSDSHEYTSIDVRGNRYWVELIATPIKDANGKVETAIEVCVDITEKKNLQSKLADYSRNLERIVEERTEQLRQTQDKLVKSGRLAAIGELASMVGHDLRNPLTSIKNAAYYLKKKQSSGTDDCMEKMLAVIDSSVAHADKIISDLQDYSKEMRLEFANCSPRAILQEALSLVQVPERVKIIDETLEEPVIRADKAKMERVFINIVKNAVEAMPKGGTLRVKSTQTDGDVEISFADTGVGMSKETLGKLFSPLVTTKAQGMGFGLAICKRIVEAHHGRISVESVEGEGSTFTVTIPTEPKLKDGGEETWVNVPESLLSTTTKT